MFDLADGPIRIAKLPFEGWLGRAKHRIERLARAWHFFTGRMSAEDAQQIMLDCRYSAGWHPLLLLSVEETLERARDRFVDHPDLAWLIAEGCIHVERKWESYGDDLELAQDWAIELAMEYAIEDGIDLTRHDDHGGAP